MIAGSLMAPFYFSWSALLLFCVSIYVTLLLGHSVGFHRMMIHRSFTAKKPLRRLLIFIGVLVGMGGPSNVIRVHDIRDWAQRLPECHDYFSHRRGYAQDVFWQLFCGFEFERPPRLQIEKDLTDDAVFRALDKGWWGLQIFLAILFYWAGGVAWVLWGCCLRVFISIWGHWTVTYFCHNPGPGTWHVIGAGVQASNLRFGDHIAGFLTHGECWHNNHHAFPESARIGLEHGQLDPAWTMITALKKCGWVSGVGHPRGPAERDDLRM